MSQLRGFLTLNYVLNPDPGKLIMDKIGETITENKDNLAPAVETTLEIGKI